MIKLELQPLDPRSLIQGDYVILGYSNSTIEIKNIEQGEKVQIVLAPNEVGVYEYTGVYKYKGEFNKEYRITDTDVMINAKYDGWNRLIYGIESFFVPEGTGREVERNANYAYVKVASNGDSILIERDMVYHWMARNRYKWFGKKDQCMMPTLDIKERFLE